MTFLALLAAVAIPIVAMLLLRNYRNSFQPPRRSSSKPSNGWNEVLLEARKLRAAQAEAKAAASKPDAGQPRLP